ncbi:UDP-3-O-acyl-N-acetylglucosamine deacetylase [Aphanothece sacrum]|uniref:UDP-3-O-acyl-N-acetylglucosamine deacetylase n=1 Tax=Aphanothece sacrum FPU1 TaxID=1920663 RepID=A0A401IDA8_APHSA|nr:UDP-3-O-acyl-N-acetylglucosamine deacetylase [Aphanothece sacrum]GBF79232.1 UDP-3-0-acyl N-acetylglucosamine deacetylase [Aphanothece sacrum FPU1]GBF84170.1 UDP-3-0-acyl N-acetylglucosamine deacetylase [Aphanothece sacrum FPU3]
MKSTIDKEFTLSGIGLHSGVNTQVKVLPANSGEGRYFVRVDLPDQPIIPAHVSAVNQTTLSTQLGVGNAQVCTVEHLLAALVASGIENARIEIDGPEVPLLDGSAKIWLEALVKSGFIPSKLESANPILEPIWVRDGDTFVAAIPASEIRFSYGIDFAYEAIGNQWYSWCPKQESFAEMIAPARTFGFADQIEQLKQAGLIKGGSLDNALVCDRQGWLNPPLRFDNEPVRHKLLDLIGDLSLLGTIPQAHFLAYKASHKLHVQLAQEISEKYHTISH